MLLLSGLFLRMQYFRHQLNKKKISLLSAKHLIKLIVRDIWIEMFLLKVINQSNCILKTIARRTMYSHLARSAYLLQGLKKLQRKCIPPLSEELSDME